MNKKNIFLASFLFMLVNIIFQIVLLTKLSDIDSRLQDLESQKMTCQVPGDSSGNSLGDSIGDALGVPSGEVSTDTPGDSADVTPDDSADETPGDSSDDMPDNSLIDSPGESTDDSFASETDNDPLSNTPLVVTDYSDLDTVISEDYLRPIFENTLFVGDSRMEGIYKFTDAGLISDFCCGIGYNIKTISSQTVTSNPNLTLIQALQEKPYNRIIICLGFNELGWKSIDSFVAKYKELLISFSEMNHSVEICVCPLFPVYDLAGHLKEYENNERIQSFNSSIKKMCEEQGYRYLDVSTFFTNAYGNLLPESTEDGIHFSSKYDGLHLYQLTKALSAP